MQTNSQGRTRWQVVLKKISLSQRPPGCETDNPWRTWVPLIDQAATRMGYNLNRDFRSLGVSLPKGFSCSWAHGYGFPPGCSGVISGAPCGLFVNPYADSDPASFLHEALHTKNIIHANSLTCKQNTFPCRHIVEYGDIFDIMGNWIATPTMLNPALADDLGWLTNSNIIRLGKRRQKINLRPYGQTGASTTRRVASTYLEGLGDVYVSYRSNTGADRALFNRRPQQGFRRHFCIEPNGHTPVIRQNVFIHFSPRTSAEAAALTGSSKNYGSYLVNKSTGLFSDCYAGMQAGESWTSPGGKLFIRYLKENPRSLAQIYIKQVP